MIIAATKPTMPASPKDCTSPTILSAIPPTNGTFPPSSETSIPNPSSDITTLVREDIVDDSPANIFITSLFFLLNKKQNEQLIRFAHYLLPLIESGLYKIGYALLVSHANGFEYLKCV